MLTFNYFSLNRSSIFDSFFVISNEIISIPVELYQMMTELKWLHKVHQVHQVHQAVQMLVRKIVENCSEMRSWTHRRPFQTHCLYLQIYDKSVRSSIHFSKYPILFNLPTSICELCAWFSALLLVDVEEAAAPRLATSDSAAMLSWMDWP